MGSGTSTTIKRAPAETVGGEQRARWHRRATAFYEQLRSPAVGLIRRAYGSTFSDEEIEDIYSSAWLGALRALERKHDQLDDDEIRKYVLTAVANHASKEIRRRRRKPVAPLEAAGSVAETTDTPEEAVTNLESRQLTRDLLASLPPRRRAVMLLRYGWGLEPSEVCGMVEGLSPRAYRKEITRGVEELTHKVKLVDDGRWCEEREALLRAYAAGLADRDEVVQAQRHLEHCRHCSEFVGKLAAHLHDLGSAVVVPGALEALDGDVSLFERAGGVLDRVREAASGVLSRGDGVVEVANAAHGVRGAGAAGAGLAAKVAGFGAAGKAVLACAAGGAAVTACVAAGLLPGPVGAKAERGVEETTAAELSPGRDQPEHVTLPPSANPVVRNAEPTAEERSKSTHREAGIQPSAPLAPDTPPTEQEFGVAAAAVPVASPTAEPATADSDSGGDAVAQEFGP